MGNTHPKDAKADVNVEPPLLEKRSAVRESHDDELDVDEQQQQQQLQQQQKQQQLQQQEEIEQQLEKLRLSQHQQQQQQDDAEGDGSSQHLAQAMPAAHASQPVSVPSPTHHRLIFPISAKEGVPEDIESGSGLSTSAPPTTSRKGEGINRHEPRRGHREQPTQPRNGASAAQSATHGAHNSAGIPAPPDLDAMIPPLDPHSLHMQEAASIVVEGARNEHAVPTTFVWKGAGNEVAVSGTFNDWQDPIPLERQPDGTFSTVMHLPPGEYQYKYHVDRQWVHDEHAPTCSNSLGSINNLVKIVGSTLHLSGEDSLLLVEESTDGRASPEGSYGQEVPELWNAKPPVLPPQLLDVTLNAQHPSNDPTQLPEPHHVMLSHLYALSIKDNVIVLGCTNRYRKKYVTTVLYKPFET